MTCLGGRGLLTILILVGMSLMGGQKAWGDINGGSQTKIPIEIPMLNPGEVILHWTATGDDGYVGRTAGYDIRYLPAEIGPIVNESRWNQAVQLGGEPIPSMAGQMDSMLVSGLNPGASYYFSIKAYDEAGNYSGLSNSPLVQAAGGFIVGDVNGSGFISGLDIVYLASYLKGEGPPPPDPILRADCNGNCSVTGTDVNYLVSYLKGSGPAPIRGNCGPILGVRGSQGLHR